MRQQREAQLVLRELAQQKQQRAGVEIMAIWDLLNCICFFSPIGSALESAKHAKAGIAGFVLTTFVGVALGVVCTWAMWNVAEKIFKSVESHPKSKQERYFSVVYVSAVLWIVFVILLSNWVMSGLLRLVV